MWPMTQFRRLPRSAQAFAVLRGTLFTVSFTIGVWLVVWLLLVRPTVNLIAVVPDVLPVSLHSVSGLLRSSVDKDEGIWESPSFSFGSDLLDEVRSSLRNHSGRPIILYLTGARRLRRCPERIQ